MASSDARSRLSLVLMAGFHSGLARRVNHNLPSARMPAAPSASRSPEGRFCKRQITTVTKASRAHRNSYTHLLTYFLSQGFGTEREGQQSYQLLEAALAERRFAPLAAVWEQERTLKTDYVATAGAPPGEVDR